MTESSAINPQQERLAALYEVSSRLSSTLDVQELLDQVMDSLIQLTGAERGFLMLFEEENGDLETVAARNVDQVPVEGEDMKISRTVVRRVVDSGEAVLTGNAQEDSRFSSHQSVIGLQLRSIMAAPLRTRGRVIGAAYVDNRLQAGVFSEEDLDLLRAFVNQAAIAIDNARLFRRTDEALARRVDELTLFQRIDQQLNRSLDLNQVLSLALEWAISLTGAHRGSIGLLQPLEEDEPDEIVALAAAPDLEQEEAVLRLLVYQGDHSQRGGQSVATSHPILTQVLNEGQPVHSYPVTAAQAIDGSPAADQLAVPIQREGQMTGLIALESQYENAFSEEDIAFVQRLADRAAVAIENARLYQEIRRTDKAKSEFISLVTHELRVPMTSIRGYTDLLLGEMVGPLADPQKEFLQTIRRNLDRMSVLIRDLSDINRIESGRMKFEVESFDLRQVVRNVANDLQEAIAGKEQELVLEMAEPFPVVCADRTRIGQVLTNLLSNAHKYTPCGGRLTIRLEQDGQMAQVDVIDTGIGISEENQAKLFTQFFRADDVAVREQSGWGLGLSIVKKMVDAQGGRVSFESEVDKGSRFSFTVPLAKEGGNE